MDDLWTLRETMSDLKSIALKLHAIDTDTNAITNEIDTKVSFLDIRIRHLEKENKLANSLVEVVGEACELLNTIPFDDLSVKQQGQIWRDLTYSLVKD